MLTLLLPVLSGLFLLFSLPAVADGEAKEVGPETAAKQDAACAKQCGYGFYFDRKGTRNNGKEKICLKFTLPCGYNCTTDWEIEPLVNGTDFTCQTAVQIGEKLNNHDCARYCGEGFNEANVGTRNNEREVVCTRYTETCGYNCTTGWDIEISEENEDYTCRTAIQTINVKNMSDCAKYCGDGFDDPRLIDGKDGPEIVCTRYPYRCGYGCTTGWNIERLVHNSNHTCQTAIQDGKNFGCVRYCGEGFFYDKAGTLNNGQEIICVKYPEACGASCTTGWKERSLVFRTNYTCKTALQRSE